MSTNSAEHSLCIRELSSDLQSCITLRHKITDQASIQSKAFSGCELATQSDVTCSSGQSDGGCLDFECARKKVRPHKLYKHLGDQLCLVPCSLPHH